MLLDPEEPEEPDLVEPDADDPDDVLDPEDFPAAVPAPNRSPSTTTFGSACMASRTAAQAAWA